MAAERERYSIVKRIDKGGMAEVFLGRSTSLEGFDKVVAIKRVLPDLALNDRFVNMFLDEAKLSLHLDHANIVSVFDVGRSGQSYFIVMEFIDGTNMKRLIEGRAMPLDLACYVAIEVCKGLVYAHEKIDGKGQPLQIVHRDISPPNILISREGEVKLTDFGLARAASQLETTDPGVVKGKFAYLSPEAAMGEEVDLRADIFAAGIVLWESLAGRRLFQGSTDLETLENVRACKVPSIHRVRSDIPASLDRILSRALAKNPADRYSSAREFGRELSQFLVEQRMSVTSYDLSAWIQELLDLPPDVSRLSPSLAESAVQAELERFVGLEDDSVVVPSSARTGRSVTQSSFEDPRLWGFVDDAGGQAIEQMAENTPSGVFDLRSGTQRLGRPLTEGETMEPSSQQSGLRAQLPPSLPDTRRPPTTKSLPRGAVIPTKGSGARRLPPPITSGPPSTLPPPAKPSAPPRQKPEKATPGAPRAAQTMMMTPIDEEFFDSLDRAPTDSPERPAPEKPEKIETSVSVQHTPPPRRAPEEETGDFEVGGTQRFSPSSFDDHSDVFVGIEAEATAATNTPQKTEPMLAGAIKERVAEPEATPANDVKPAAPTPEAAPVAKASSKATLGRPWFSQLVTIVAFGAVAYLSYLILGPLF